MSIVMKKQSIHIGKSSTDFYWNSSIKNLTRIADPAYSVIITDKNVYSTNTKVFKGWNVIVLKPGEEFKVQETVNSIIEQLIRFQVDRSFTLIGVGGGVVTDLTGYVASIYMRGIRFGFVPTSLLAIVDASIGGKNGIDVGLYKNMLGVIRQPDFILHDLSLLKSLPLTEWKNGFAEIIKHACIRDRSMFNSLSKQTLKKYQQSTTLLASLLKRNALIKIKLVQKDEFEKGDRRLLNFGHTLGHALENQYELSHGQAIAIGMTYAAEFSKEMVGFKEVESIVELLNKYGLPTYAKFDAKKVIKLMSMDKKRNRTSLYYVFLKNIGKGEVKLIPVSALNKMITSIS
jgi:3-dehydroquinate synthase